MRWWIPGIGESGGRRFRTRSVYRGISTPCAARSKYPRNSNPQEPAKKSRAECRSVERGLRETAATQVTTMVQYQYHLRSSNKLDYAILTAAACLSLYLYVRPALKDQPRRPTTLRAKARDATRRLPDSSAALPYPPDVFPGARDVETEYGTIKVFEWGPDEGDKVLLMHGIGTPCVALGDMAHEFVRRGCRVMLFGE